MSTLCEEIKPSDWGYQSVFNEAVEVSVSSEELSKVRGLLNGEALSNLQRVVKVHNPYLYGRYLMRKEEYCRRNIVVEKTLLHATAATKVSSIIRDNLDWRLANRVKFGRGVSFSDCATYANKECSRNNGNDRAIIICKVLIGMSTSGSCLTSLPPKPYDTTTGNYGRVFVKYYDDEFYPEYVAYYTNTLSFGYHSRGFMFHF